MTKKKTTTKAQQPASQAKTAKAKPSAAGKKSKPSAAAKSPAKPAAKAKKADGATAKKKTAEAKPAAGKKAVEPAAAVTKAAAKKPQRTAAERQKLVGKLHKVLKSHYSPRLPDTSRPLLEQVLFACCLENADYDAAEKAFTRLLENSFDLNEVRVTTVAELAEVLAGLPDPSKAALALRRTLQSVFESTYSFSLDHAKKQSVSQGVKTRRSSRSTSPPPRWVGTGCHSTRVASPPFT
jgi:hypothetical protein